MTDVWTPDDDQATNRPPLRWFGAIFSRTGNVLIALYQCMRVNDLHVASIRMKGMVPFCVKMVQNGNFCLFQAPFP
jgi:hypothetical protein